MGYGGARLPLTEVPEAVEVTRDRATFGDDTVPADFVLTVDNVEAVDVTLERGPEEGVTSDFAVSKVVELSLVEDRVDPGRERSDGGRRVDGPATFLRTVDVWDLTDFTDVVEDLILLDLSSNDVGNPCFRGVLAEWDPIDCEDVSSVKVERAEADMDLPGCVGASFESGRTPVPIVLRDVIVVRDTVDCVLRAIDLMEAADDLTASPPALAAPRDNASVLSDRTLTPSSSAFVTLRPLPARGVDLGVVATGGPYKSSTGTSISEDIVSYFHTFQKITDHG